MKRKYGGLKKKEGERKRVDGMDFFWGVGNEEEGVMLGRIVYYGCIL